MAGPIRRLIAKRPVRNAIRRAVGLPEIAGQSSALSESRTTARRLGRNRPSEPQFRSIGDRSARSDFRGVKAGQAAKPAPAQKDADAPDTAPSRVFTQSDPDTLNGKMKAATASDNAQKTDLDAGPRRVGGRDITPQLAAGNDESLKAGLKVDAPVRVNTTEVAVKPSAQAISIRQARDEDEARRVRKRKESEGLAPSQPEARRIPRPDTSAMQTEYDTLMTRAKEKRAIAEAIRNSPGYSNDPQLMVQRQYSDAYTEAELAEMQARAMLEKMSAMGFLADKDEAELAYKFADIASRDRATSAQYPDPAQQLNENLGTIPETVKMVGVRAAGDAAYRSDLSQYELKGVQLDPTEKAALRETNLRVAAIVGLSDALERQERLRPESPLVQELAGIAREQAPEDLAQRRMLINQIAMGAVTRASANGAQLSESAPAQLESALSSLVEQVISGMPMAQQGGGMLKWLQSYGKPETWGFGKPQNMGGVQQ